MRIKNEQQTEYLSSYFFYMEKLDFFCRSASMADVWGTVSKFSDIKSVLVKLCQKMKTRNIVHKDEK